MKPLFLAIPFFLTGCAAQKRITANVVVPRHCMTAVELTERSQCTGADLEHLHCTGLSLTEVKGCETLQVNSKEKETKEK